MSENLPLKISDLVEKVVSQLNIPEEVLEKAIKSGPEKLDKEQREQALEEMRTQLVTSRAQIDKSDISIAAKIEYLNRWQLAAELYEAAKETHQALLDGGR
jgi:ribosome maturation protein Sdo1